MQRGQQRCRQHVGPVAHVGDQPLGHVGDAGVDAGGRGHAVVGGLGRERGPAAARAHVRPGPARAVLDTVQPVAGIVHAQRLEQPPRYRLVEELARGGEDHVANQAEGHVLVAVAVAGLAGHRCLRQPLHQAGVFGAGLDVAVIGVPAKADPVAEHVGHGDHLRRFGVGHAQARHVIDHAAVPAHRALGHQHAGDGAGEGLGQRCQAEHGVRIDRFGGAHVGDAVSARAEHLAVVDDGHRQAGHALALHQGFGHRLEFVYVESLRQRHDVFGRGKPGWTSIGRRREGRHGFRERGNGLRGHLHRRLRRGAQREGHQHAHQSNLPGPAASPSTPTRFHFHRVFPLRMLCLPAR